MASSCTVGNRIKQNTVMRDVCCKLMEKEHRDRETITIQNCLDTEKTNIAKCVASNGANVKRIVISNGQGRRVQLIGWGDDTFVLEKYDVKQVVLIERVKCRFVPSGSRYNAGNVPFELTINKNSNPNFMGEFEELEEISPVLTKATFTTIRNLKNPVYIEGYIKNNFAELKMKGKKNGVGSITDGIRKLEIHILNYSEHDFQKGSFIGVTGNFKPRDNAPPYLQIADIKAIELKDEKKKESLFFLLNGYKYVE
ncbi:hypothetical protein QAD02_008176 [Eretmocerus hayati]|uniref:Uncharacterized protein n=1 Tax=Eretmocerus hayati TaxID=131215 RepID=A0ACC2N854_9HYME|nr:hypothetical protein QAD02_008176 [Eretmocerus hayati]